MDEHIDDTERRTRLMERPAYRHELLMTRADGTHLYAVHAHDVGQIGVIESHFNGRSKVWSVQPFYGEPGCVTRTFPTRSTAADVLYAFWREWRTRLDQAQGR